MKMSEFELQDVASTFKQEDLSNLKAIQGELNRELNRRYGVDKGYLDCCVSDVPTPIQQEKKMNTASSMSIVASVPAETLAERRISFLNNHLENARTRKETELERHFGLIDDEAPRNPKELVERIKDGLYVIPEAYSTEEGYLYNPSNYIEWRNPKVKKDKDGHLKAKKEMHEHYREAQRIIVLKDEEKGLAALEKFEKTKFH